MECSRSSLPCSCASSAVFELEPLYSSKSCVVRQDIATSHCNDLFRWGVTFSARHSRLIRGSAGVARRERGPGTKAVPRLRQKGKSVVVGEITIQSTPLLHNDGAGRRVSARIESRFRPWSGLPLADLLGCPSRARGASGLRGSSKRIRPSVTDNPAEEMT